MFRTAALALAAIIAIVAGAMWWTRGSESVAKAGLLQPNDAAIVARGKAVYDKACASCHGANLEGQPGWRTAGGGGTRPAPPHDQTGHTWHHPDQLLLEITRQGTAKLFGGRGGGMPGFADQLADEDIIAALSYIKSRWPEKIRRVHDRINAKAAARQ